MKWRLPYLSFGEIAATLIVVMIGGLVLSGGLIVESYHANFGACSARGVFYACPRRVTNSTAQH
jgi:hypothetical protein